ncbi:PREDICTED: uncharacterized protein LOC104610483 [Nelumbo nucifera]|uniref:Uncharacterized protein n=2 Tax=Nelumbo nucifera TaxID=4432 RepID=A0A822XLJ0_NELNU|nr:PREDICTED: uncharacterized protein LOC104610483 [Nelumbo nucifera]DAD18398.1 TPA_asm: hypothetical protein HUJ06_019861 [Nelumbo nucifera]
MGMFMSFMGNGPSLKNLWILDSVTDELYKRFIKKPILDFEDFHLAILDIFSSFNSSLPGRHYDVPPQEDVEACFRNWEAAPDSEKKKVFIDFVKKNAKLSKLDDTTVIVGLVTPPAAMVLKRVGENVPQVKKIKVIPDSIFVPSATLLALVSVRLTRRMSPVKKSSQSDKKDENVRVVCTEYVDPMVGPAVAEAAK